MVAQGFRRGAARDLANLKSDSSVLMGTAPKDVARVIGDSVTSFQRNNGQQRWRCAQDKYSARAEQMFVRRKAPATRDPYKKRRLTKSEITTYCEANNRDSISSTARRNASEALHAKRKADLIESERTREATPSKTPQTSMSTPSIVSRTSTSSLPMSSATYKTPSTSSLGTTPIPATSSVNNTTQASVNTTSASLIATIASHIDLRLLTLDAGDVDIDEAVAQRLDSIVHSDAGKLGEAAEAAYLDMFLENVYQGRKSGILTLPGREFVESLSRINIVRNQPLERHIRTLDEVLPLHCPMGNSRDYPTLFRYKCDNCEDYSSHSRDNMNSHQMTCNGKDARVEKKKPFI